MMIIFPAEAFLGRYPVQNFTSSDYLAGIQNIDFAQNRDMTLFVANNLGVLAFNGNEWETHATKTGKKQRSLAFDSEVNRLYLGSQGEFGYFEEDWNYVSLNELVPTGYEGFDEVWDVFLLNSKIYFCTFQTIFVYDGKSISVIEREGGFDRSFHTDNKLFTQSPVGELFEVRGTELVLVQEGPTDEGTVAGIIGIDGGYLVFRRSGKIALVNSFGVEEQYSNLVQELQGTYVNHVMQLSDTRLVIATQTSGLFLFDMSSEIIEHISTKDGLQSNACLTTFQDHAGSLWVGMQNGMALIDINSPMRLISKEIDLQGSGYDAFELEEGSYYTTSNGIYFLARNKEKCIFIEGTQGPAYSIQLIAGNLYAGHHTGLFLLKGGKATKVATTEGLWKVMQLKSNPTYAIAGTYSGLYLFKLNGEKLLTPVKRIAGFNESSRFFQEDRAGSIWVGQFYKGLFRLDLSKDLASATATRIEDSNDLPINERIVLSQLDGEIHVATEEGIYQLDQSNQQIVPAEIFSHVVGEKQVYLLEQSNQKHIYVYAENLVGFFKQISASNYTYVPSSLFQLRHSFNNDLLNISKNTSDGVLFNANEGFIQYNPDLEDRVATNKPPLVSRIYNVGEDSLLFVRLPFEERTQREEKVITEVAKVIEFDVESFKFKDVNNQQFRFFLKGFDEDFGKWTNNTTKEYTNLREGRYEFFIQTLDYLGEPLTSEPLLMIVTPPWYRSLVAKIIYALLTLYLLFEMYRFQKKRNKRRLMKVDEERQKELAQKQEELQQLKEEGVENELQHLNNLLAASTMNLVVKNEFLETVKEELKEVREKGKYAETKQSLSRIVKDIDTTLRLQEDWKQFEFHFDKVHGDFLNRLREQFEDLSPTEQKLCAYLRLNLNTKEIANLMGISQRGVEVSRYRLRKKLDLPTAQNLSKFILEY